VQQQQRSALEHATDPALVGSELVDDLVVPIGHSRILSSFLDVIITFRRDARPAEQGSRGFSSAPGLAGSKDDGRHR
jgi:hypothetical protein